MKLIRKINKQLAALVLALVLTATPQLSMAAQLQNTTASKQEIRLQDDFYEAVNKDWLKSTKLKPGYTSLDTMDEMSDRCDEQIQALFADILKNESKYDKNSTEKKMINLYHNYLNKAERNKQGIQPIKPYLESIKQIKTTDDLNKLLTSDLLIDNLSGICNLNVTADFKDSNKKSLYLFSTSLLLGDSDYYNKPSDMAKALEAATTTYLNKILVLAGYSKEDASKKVAQAYEFEKLLAPSIMGSDEVTQLTNRYETLYNPYTLDDLDKLAPNLKLKSYIEARTQNKVNKVIVAEPKWLKALDKVYTNDNIELLKNYLEIHFLMGISGDLSEDFLTAAVEYANQITGATGSIPDEEKAMNAVQGFFTDEIGKLYCDHYFSKESKADVEKLVKEIIAAYKKKIEAVDWMTAETKKNAIKKLDTMKIKIGYPEKWDDYSKLEIKSYEEGGSLLENSLSIMNWQNEQAIDELDKPVDKTEFGFPPQMVNACYDPSNNDLTFPAAILQAPYYDIKQSREKNLGAIGVVIAHEISHAFDTSGANFDCNGNLVQWWTPEDYAKFQEKANTFKTFYSNITTDSGDKVNGDLTVGENIADITAMSCMLDIMKEMDHPDYKAFFESWANAWHMISTPEYTKLLLEQDVHSPNKVRANAVVQQFQEFYDTYDVKEGDGMYVKPEDRLKLY